MIKWLVTHKLTVCDELHRQGYLTDEELRIDKKYGGDNYHIFLIGAYKLISPILVYVMRKSKRTTKLIHDVACKVWFNKFL